MDMKKTKNKKSKYRDLETIELLAIYDVVAFYNSDLISELCRRAGLREEWEQSTAETFGSVLSRAVEILRSWENTEI